MNIRIVSIMFFISLILVGCIPKVRTVQPEITGTIIDAETNKPIAEVLISGHTKSQKTGIFKIKAITELVIAIPVGGIYPIERRFAIGKKGYLPRVCIFSTLTTMPASEHATIKLIPSNTGTDHNETTLQQLISVSHQHSYRKANPYALPKNIHHQIVCSEPNLTD